MLGGEFGPFDGYKDGSVVGYEDIDGVDDGSKDGNLDGILLMLGVSDGKLEGYASAHAPQYKGQLAIVPLKVESHRCVGFSFTQLQVFISDPESKFVDSTVNGSGLLKHSQLLHVKKHLEGTSL